jgi:hypothetical protein
VQQGVGIYFLVFKGKKVSGVGLRGAKRYLLVVGLSSGLVWVYSGFRLGDKHL